MKTKQIHKLCSQTGASITFALLLFLVCSVVSVVVLVAATTTTGRIVGIAEADQRYYAVTSASALLKGLIENETVTVQKVTPGTRTDLYQSGNRTKSTPTFDETQTITTINSASVPGTFDSLAKYAAYQCYCCTDDEDKDEDKKADFVLAPESMESLKVGIQEKVGDDGTITLIVRNDLKSRKDFEQKLMFSAVVTGPVISEVPCDSTTTVNSDQYQVTTQLTKTETTTIKWTLKSVETVKTAERKEG